MGMCSLSSSGSRHVSSLAVLLVAWCSAGRAGARSPSCEAAERVTLKNGVEVFLQVDRALPAVALVSSVHAGSRHDPPGYEGLAHFVEHLTFRQSGAFAAAFDLYEEAGAIDVNATTSRDTTDYLSVVPAAQVERAIWVEARRLAVGLNTLEEPPALEERRVLLREQELRYGRGPWLPLITATYAALYPTDHPYHPPFATSESMGRLTLADARWFFAEHYRPDRVRLALVGDFRVEEVKPLIERYFGGLTPPWSRVSEPEAPSVAECRWAKATYAPSSSRIILRSLYRNEGLELAWPVRGAEDPESFSATFSLLLGEVRSAASQVGLSHDVTGGLVIGEVSSFWRLAIDVVPGQPLDKVEPLIGRALGELRSSLLDERDLGAARQSIELSEQLEETRLLSRALRLVRRECIVSTCVDVKEQLRASALVRLDRFEPSKALIVERRYSPGAAEDGDIERVP